MSKLYTAAKFLFSPLIKLIFNMKIVNKEGFPLDETVIVALNHTSNWDPVLSGVACRKQLYFMAKAELFKFKPFGYLIKKLGAFPVNRGHRDSNATKNVYDIIASGKTLAMFPQGTRIPKKEDPSDAKAGIAVFSVTSNTGVLPVYIHNAKGKVRLFSRNTVVIGDVIPASEFVTEKGTLVEARVKAEMLMSKIFELKEKVPCKR